MNQVDPISTADDPSTDRVLTFVLRYSTPVAVVGIVGALAFYWWLLGL